MRMRPAREPTLAGTNNFGMTRLLNGNLLHKPPQSCPDPSRYFQQYGGRGAAMAIYRLLKEETAFDDAAVKAMTSAYEDLLRELALAKRSDPLTHIIAEKIIQRARLGERDASRLRDLVLQELRSS